MNAIGSADRQRLCFEAHGADDSLITFYFCRSFNEMSVTIWYRCQKLYITYTVHRIPYRGFLTPGSMQAGSERQCQFGTFARTKIGPRAYGVLYSMSNDLLQHEFIPKVLYVKYGRELILSTNICFANIQPFRYTRQACKLNLFYMNNIM